MSALRISLFLALGACAWAQNAPMTKTEMADFPPGGLLRLGNAVGELTITGWDQPTIELTTIKSVKPDQKHADGLLDRVKVSMERKGDEVTVSTAYPKHSKLVRPFRGMIDFNLEYRIHIPQAARLDVESAMGEIHIENIAGNIRAKENLGEITVRLPDGMYSIDAKSKLGAVTSDFAGDAHRVRWFGEGFTGNPSGAVQSLFLRAQYGDILIFKTH